MSAIHASAAIAVTVAIPALGVFAADLIDAKNGYDAWVETHAKKELVGTHLNPQRPMTLFVAQYDEDDRHGRRVRPFGSRETEHAWEVTRDGELSVYDEDDMGSRGGGGNRLDQAALALLDQLLANLPDDGSRLPPPHRKLLLQASVDGKLMTRVYDRANAPELVWKILRTARCDVAAAFPEFKPQSQLDARGYEHDGFLCLSPTGGELLFTGLNQPLQFWDPTTHEFLREIRGVGSYAIAFSPDGARAVVSDSGLGCQRIDTKTWKVKKEQTYFMAPQFTPDGRQVLLSNGKKPLKILDAVTWRSVERVTGIPKDAVTYLPAPKNQRAIVQSMSGNVSLWDPDGEQPIAKLEENAVLREAAFSPDESLVAVQTEGKDKLGTVARFGIWRTDNGQLVHELNPYERNGRECARGLLWSPDGQYVVAAVVPGWGSNQSVAIFNRQTGRQSGEFTGCLRINGLVLLPDGSQLVAGCEDGKIRFWDFPKALETVKSFEASLERP